METVLLRTIWKVKRKGICIQDRTHFYLKQKKSRRGDICSRESMDLKKQTHTKRYILMFFHAYMINYRACN